MPRSRSLAFDRKVEGRRSGAPEGQALVLVVLAIVVLLGFAALAFDLGRFYSERRFLQNAADAAALAAANSLIAGNPTSQADTDARAILTRDLAGSPTGSNAQQPPATPVYADGHSGDPLYLTNGILFTGGDVRVAVQSDVSWTLARVLGFSTNRVGAAAHVKMRGNMLPIAVRRFVNAPGPANNPSSPCTNNQNDFMDFFATANTACQGTDTSGSRDDPGSGLSYDSSNPNNDPGHHGPVVTIVGQGAQPSNGSDFRGFIALDIRNFQSTSTQLYYNGVEPSTNSQTLKQMEAGWIADGGYPGPMLPSILAVPDPNDQVAIMSGNDTGIAISEINQHFFLGQEVLVAVYPGQTMQIPDFSMSSPPEIDLPTSGTVNSAGSFKVSRNQAFSGTVTLTTWPDLNDPANPLTTGTLTATNPNPDPTHPLDAAAYNPNEATPTLGSGETVQMQNMTTNGAPVGIYTLWLQGQAGSPYLTTKYVPLSVNVGGVSKDFTITSNVSEAVAANPGDDVSFTLNLQNSASGSFGGSGVSLSIEGPAPNGSLPAGFGWASFSRSIVNPTGGNGTDSTLTINTGTMSAGQYRFVVRATGMNGDNPTAHKVTHLLPITVDVGTASAGGNQDYVDISGFAIMRITYMDTNHVDAYAITPVIPDMNDSRLLLGQVAKLVPWNYN